MLMKRFGKPSTWTAASRVTGAAFMLLGPGGLAGCKQGGVVDNQNVYLPLTSQSVREQLGKVL